MKTNKRILAWITLTSLCMTMIFTGLFYYENQQNKRVIKVAYIYEGDGSTPYTKNFMRAQQSIEQKYGDSIESVAFYNVKDDNIEAIYQKLLESNCDIVFATSYGFQNVVKQWAKDNPDIQFCQATGDNANTEEKLANYHNYMGMIYQGRYVAGVVAGAKLKEMIAQGQIDEADAKIGYVAAFPYAEVISGYTAFYMGVYSQVPTVTMEVEYVNSWSDYAKEKKAARRMIEDGCNLISQHSDTIGSAVACQELREKYPVIHVGYNESMMDVAPTTSLISSKINWEPYESMAIEAMLKDKDIEDVVSSRHSDVDAWGGFKQGWVELIGMNEFIMAEGTEDLITETIEKLEKETIQVFSGPFTGTNPYDSEDTIDLSKEPFQENATASAPAFHYVLDDVIQVVE